MAAVYEVARYRGDRASAASEGRRTASNADDVRPGEGIRAHRLRHGETKVRAVVRDKCRRHEEAHVIGGFVTGVKAVESRLPWRNGDEPGHGFNHQQLIGGHNERVGAEDVSRVDGAPGRRLKRTPCGILDIANVRHPGSADTRPLLIAINSGATRTTPETNARDVLDLFMVVVLLARS